MNTERSDWPASLTPPGQSGIAGESEEDEGGSTESDHLFVAEPTDAGAKLRTGNSRELVDHEAARLPQPVHLVGFDGKSEQRGRSRVGS